MNVYTGIQEPLRPLAATFHKQSFIVNELLCYIQNKMDTVPFNVLAKLTSDFYASDEIKQAKELLFQLVSRPGHRFRQCIGPNKSLEDVRDMLKLLLSAELSEVPIFLALDITRLPPMSSDCQESMKTSIDLLSDTQKDLASIVHAQQNEPLRLRDGFNSDNSQTVSQKQSESPESVTTKHTPCDIAQLDVVETESMEDSLSPAEEDPNECEPLEMPFVKPRTILNSNLHRPQANGQKGSHSQSRPFTTWSSLAAGKPKTVPVQPARASAPAPAPSAFHNPKGPQKDNVMVGCGTAPGLQVARRGGFRNQNSGNNRQCTGIFVTNLHPKTTSQQLDTFIRRETGLKMVSEKLQTRFSTYSSFYIRSDQRNRSMLMDPYLWPEDCKVKPYFS